jgi:drug/metabolite transporter (DMT)-like permease
VTAAGQQRVHAPPPGEAGRPGAPRGHGLGLMDLALLGVVIVWGGNFVVLKAAVGEFLPLTLTAVRFTLASALFLPPLLGRWQQTRLTRADWLQIALLGLIGNVGYQFCAMVGLSRTTAGNTALIIAATPALVAVLSHAFGLERLSSRAWAGAALSFAGLALVIGLGSGGLTLARETLAGNLLVLGAALCWAVSILITQPLVSRLPVLTVNALSNLISVPAIVLIALPALRAQDWASVSGTAWTLMAASALLAITIAYSVWTKGVQRLGSTRAAVYANLIPVIAALLGVAFLGERIVAPQVAGAAMVLGGVAMARLR